MSSLIENRSDIVILTGTVNARSRLQINDWLTETLESEVVLQNPLQARLGRVMLKNVTLRGTTIEEAPLNEERAFYVQRKLAQLSLAGCQIIPESIGVKRKPVPGIGLAILGNPNDNLTRIQQRLVFSDFSEAGYNQVAFAKGGTLIPFTIAAQQLESMGFDLSKSGWDDEIMSRLQQTLPDQPIYLEGHPDLIIPAGR